MLPERIQMIEYPDFVTRRTFKLFSRFDLDSDILSRDASSWHSEKNFREAKDIFSNLVIVNGAAERAIKLVLNMSGKFT